MNSFKQTIDKSWTLFLDRDGVINERIVDSYVKEIEEFKFIKGSKEAIGIFSKYFGRIFVVTNQQGIGKGYMTECNLSDVHDYMRKEVEMIGGWFTDIFFAPQLAAEESIDRKPQIGMGLKAKNCYPEVDFSKSIMIGDSDSDITFGKNLGMITVKIGDKDGSKEKADYYCNRLEDCVKLLKL